MRPAPSARTLTCLVAVAGVALLEAAGLVLKAVASGAGWLQRHIDAAKEIADGR